MRFSTKAEYGLKAMINLALSYPKIKSLKDVSSEEGISFKYLERIICDLRKCGIIESHKGKDGGYVLAQNPSKVKIGEIVEILEGPIEIMKCESKKCSSLHCRSKKVWVEVGKQVRKTLDNITLLDLIK